MYIVCRFTPTPVGKNAWNYRKPMRFTPTPVGKTWRAAMLRIAPAVHPHACGENQTCPVVLLDVAVHPHACGENAGQRTVVPHRQRGSPPRLWGKTPHRRGTNCDGSPPRLWGKRAPAQTSQSLAVHPHACGENRSAQRFTPTPVGKTHMSRFTPTPVGKTVLSSLFSGSPPPDDVAVHPHACGENSPLP